jgi:hypothetical protein
LIVIGHAIGSDRLQQLAASAIFDALPRMAIPDDDEV